MGFDHSFIIRVQQANDIIEIVSEHVNLVKKGREMVGLCPFHDDHRPSMFVNPEKQIFKCFACGAGGDVLKFVQMREGLTFPQAVERLAERAHIEVPKQRYRKRSGDDEQRGDPNQLAKVNAWAAEQFAKNLWDHKIGADARKYIEQRKITVETAKKWQLGLAVKGGDLVAAAAGRNVGVLVQAGLAVDKGRGIEDKFSARLMFPILDATNRVVGFGGRTLENAPAKYMNSPTTLLFDKSRSMYGLNHARHAIVAKKTAVVVEGYTDCIMAHQFGIENTVATLGTSFTEGHAQMLKRYADRVVLVFDSDTAGQAAANRALDVFIGHRIDVKLATVPQGKDPCDFLLEAGAEGFEKVIADAEDVFSYRWNRLSESLEQDRTISERKAFLDELFEAILKATMTGTLSPMDRGLLVNKISDSLGLDQREVSRQLNQRISRMRQRQKKAKNESVEIRDLRTSAQQEILEVLLSEPVLYRSVKEKISAVDFEGGDFAEVAESYFAMLDANANAKVSEYLAKVEQPEMSKRVTEMAMAGDAKGNHKERLEEAIALLKRVSDKKYSGLQGMDEDEFLRSLSKDASRENPHNIGML